MATEPDPGDPRSTLDDRPPILRTWRAVYVVVLGTEALLILLLYLMTRAFR